MKLSFIIFGNQKWKVHCISHSYNETCYFKNTWTRNIHHIIAHFSSFFQYAQWMKGYFIFVDETNICYMPTTTYYHCIAKKKEVFCIVRRWKRRREHGKNCDNITCFWISRFKKIQLLFQICCWLYLVRTCRYLIKLFQKIHDEDINPLESTLSFLQ